MRLSRVHKAVPFLRVFKVDTCLIAHGIYLLIGGYWWKLLSMLSRRDYSERLVLHPSSSRWMHISFTRGITWSESLANSVWRFAIIDIVPFTLISLSGYVDRIKKLWLYVKILRMGNRINLSVHVWLFIYNVNNMKKKKNERKNRRHDEKKERNVNKKNPRPDWGELDRLSKF